MKRKHEKNLALSQIILLIIGIIAFSYIIESEIKVVSGVLETSDGGGVTGSPDKPTDKPNSNEIILTALSAVAGAISENFGSLSVNAAIAYVLYLTISKGGAFILPEQADRLEALGMQVVFGYGAGSGLAVAIDIIVGAFGGGSVFGIGGSIVVGAVGTLIALAMYSEKTQEIIIFTCYPWSAPEKGEDCEKCNVKNDILGLQCTEYECMSLGQGCAYVEEEHLCYWENKNDIKPPIIKPWKEVLSANFNYIPAEVAPGDTGVIVNYTLSEDGCAPAMTLVNMGVELDKRAKCKVSWTREDSFEDMKVFTSGKTNQYNHSFNSKLPGEDEYASEGKEIQGGEHEIFIRCSSTNGVENPSNFVFKYCIQNRPDDSPPSIELIVPLSDSSLAYGQNSRNIFVYTDKPADCKWTAAGPDVSYESMEGTMSCAESISEVNALQLYKCSANLTGLKDNAENKFYFRCKSYPKKEESERYVNTQSVAYILKGTKELIINSVGPSGIIKDSKTIVNVVLSAKTSAGFNEGEATCYYSAIGADTDYKKFTNTESYEHKHVLPLPEGSYRYYIRCIDKPGNSDTEEINFEVETDTTAPYVVRAYQQGTDLKIITSEEAECVYSNVRDDECGYSFIDGLKMESTDKRIHSVDWDTTKTFYIKCKDDYGNKPSSATPCSIIIRPISI